MNIRERNEDYEEGSSFFVPPPRNTMKTKEPDALDQTIQLMRTLTLAQVRKQLEHDKRRLPIRFQSVAMFFRAANEQQK